MYNNHKVSSFFENIGSVEALIIKGTGFSDKWPSYAILVHPPYFRLILILIFLQASLFEAFLTLLRPIYAYTISFRAKNS